MPMPQLYSRLASWWPLLSAPQDYREEATSYGRIFASACRPGTILELGSGGGNNASFMKKRFRMTLVDRAPAMLRVSRKLNPECRHFVGDLRTVRLGRVFDAVFVHDAVTYMTTENDLRRAMRTAWVHCAPGGAALFVPDAVKETLRPHLRTGGNDQGPRGLRYLEWTWDPEPADSTFVVDFTMLLRVGRRVRAVHDRHKLGVFSRATWMRLLGAAGFVGKRLRVKAEGASAGWGEAFLGLKGRIG
ncbi:MAG: class I SAM-dependent methyltransferase [Planctomycetes bacterium]|nr:class I SAM-dependent methyltransferase [Planctomycetota bacterium]